MDLLPGPRAIACVAAIVVFAIVMVALLLIRRHPLAFSAWMEQQRLGRLGLRKSVLNTSFGRITYWEGGSGPVLVFLHGAGDQAGTWSRVLSPLIPRHRVLLPNLAGHGDSEPTQGSLTLGMELASLEALLEARAAGQQVVLIGNSMGAWVAMLYAYRHPERVTLVTVVNGGPLGEAQPHALLSPTNREEASRLMQLVRGPSRRPVPGFVLDDVVRQARHGPIGRLLQSLADMHQYFLDDHLREFKVPVDILWGESDRLLGLEYAKRLEQGLPVARLTLLPRCGHVPQRDCPAAFATQLTQLLKEPAVRRSASTSPEAAPPLHGA